MSGRVRIFSFSGSELTTSESTECFIRNNNNADAPALNCEENYGVNSAPSPGVEVETSAGLCDVVFIILRSVSFPIDYGSDIWLMINYFLLTSEMTYGFLTLSIIILSGIARTWICYHMRHLDKRNVRREPERAEQNVIEKLPKYLLWMLHVITFFKVATWFHTWNCFYYACKSRNRSQSYKIFLKEQEDASLLGIVGGFMEAAPQLILQLYIIWVDGLSVTTLPAWLKIIGSCSTLVVLGLSSESFYINIRRAQREKATVTRTGKLLVFLWQFSMIVSRIFLLLIVVRMSLYTLLTYMFIWIGWTGWIYYKKDGVLEFCRGKETAAAATKTTIREKMTIFFISAILGKVYLFMYVNLREEPTFSRYFFYYMIWAIEISIVIAVWFTIGCENLNFEYDWYAEAIFRISTVSFVIGIGFMGTYYKFLHPTANNRNSSITPKQSEWNRIRRIFHVIFNENESIITPNENV